MVQLLHSYMTTGKTVSLTRWTFVDKVMSLLFNMLSRLVITFLPRSKRLLISWLQSPSAVILEPKKIKSVTVSIVSPSIFYEVMGLDDLFLVFWMLSFKPAFSLSSFTFIKRLFSSSLLSAIKVVSSAYLRLLIFLLAILIPVVPHLVCEMFVFAKRVLSLKNFEKDHLLRKGVWLVRGQALNVTKHEPTWDPCNPARCCGDCCPLLLEKPGTAVSPKEPWGPQPSSEEPSTQRVTAVPSNQKMAFPPLAPLLTCVCLRRLISSYMDKFTLLFSVPTVRSTVAEAWSSFAVRRAHGTQRPGVGAGTTVFLSCSAVMPCRCTVDANRLAEGTHCVHFVCLS